LPAHIGALSKTGACKNKSSAQTVFGTQTVVEFVLLQQNKTTKNKQNNTQRDQS
jgi:hypothetical protein